MNRSFFLLFFGAVLSAAAQHPLVRQSVADDGQQLVVAFDFERRGTLRHVERRWDVRGLTKAEKQARLRSLVDSLGLPPEAAEVVLLDEEVPAGAGPLATTAPLPAPTNEADWTEAVPARAPRRADPSPRRCPPNRPRATRSAATP